MKKIGSLCLILFLCVPLFSFSQDKPVKPKKKKKFLKEVADKKTFDEAELLFLEKNYHYALLEYKKLEINYPEEPILIFRIGVCYQEEIGGLDTSMIYLGRLDQEKFKKTDLAYYLGKAYHQQLKFDEAIAQFTKYMKMKQAEPDKKKECEIYITWCENGKELVKTPLEVKITNIGSPVNTVNSEYVPVISSDESVMMFTYRGEKSIGGKQFLPGKPDEENGEYYEDIFVTVKDSSGNWAEPQQMGNNINTDGHDACIALSDDGQKLFIFKNLPGDVGAIYMSTLDGKDWSDPEVMRGDVESGYWEGSVSMSSDGHTIYFSSERPDGFGGKDIYKATLRADGSWGNIQNLGIAINTESDEDAPFIHPSGGFLIFSSKGHTSMGGYDIFRVDYKDDSTWTDPYNMGYPINTSGDDIYYVLAADGKRGYYSSGKPGGNGLQDIYLIEPGILGAKIALVQVSGQITLNENPVKCEIKVTFADSGAAVQGNYKANSITGKYLINFPSGKQLKLTYTIPDYVPEVRTLSTMNIDSFFETTIDVQFYTYEYLAKVKHIKDSLDALNKFKNDSLLLTMKKDSIDKVLKKDTVSIMPHALTLKEMLDKYGNTSIPGLSFCVQIGAYNLPQNFNYTKILKIGKVKKQKLDDNITRFTVGNDKTLNDAYVLKNKLVEAGVSDAFVTAVYNGKRYLLKDLATNNFFQK